MSQDLTPQATISAGRMQAVAALAAAIISAAVGLASMFVAKASAQSAAPIAVQALLVQNGPERSSDQLAVADALAKRTREIIAEEQQDSESKLSSRLGAIESQLSALELRLSGTSKLQDSDALAGNLEARVSNIEAELNRILEKRGSDRLASSLPADHPKKVAEGVEVRLIRLVRRGTDVVAELEVTALDRDLEVGLDGGNTQKSLLITSAGSYEYPEVTLGRVTAKGIARTPMVMGVATPGRIAFGGVASDLTKAARLIVCGSVTNGKQWSVTFDNIRIE